MAYFYVKQSLGTRTTGGGLTIQSGSFATLGAASVYATIALAIADGASSGDIIAVSDAHSFSSAAAKTYTGPTTGDFLHIITVEDLNCDTSAIASAAQEYSTGGTVDISIKNRIMLSGIYLKSDDNIGVESPNSQIIFDQSTLESTGASDISLNASQDGCGVSLKETSVISNSAGFPMGIGGGTMLSVVGGSIPAGANIMRNGFTNGGGTVEFIGTDLSGVTGVLILGVGANTAADDGIDVTFKSCEISGTSTFLDEALLGLNQRLSAFNTAATSAAAEYQFYIEARGGKVEDQADTGIHRSETTAFPSGTKVSAKCLTDANASLAAPFWFELPARYAELSVASTDTLRIYLASTVALDNTDVWVEALYADGTNKHVQNFISTQNAERMTVASAGVPLDTDSSSTWLDGASALVGYNEYQIDVDTSANGSDCVPTIKIYIAIPSTTIYLDPVVDTVA